MLKLRIEDDEGQETVVPIIRDEITIGRQEGNTIRLTERNVSRRHARLVRDDGRIWIEEVSARYGIRKNGERIDDRSAFEEGDVFIIGDYRLTLQSEATAEQPPAKDAPMEVDIDTSGAPKAPAGATPAPRASENTEIMPAMPAKLVIISSNYAGQEFPLTRREMVIGRGEDCDIIIDHRSVSQRHAKIVREKGSKYQIVDLNSKNGVRISGDKYNSTHLKRGDVVELGHVKFRFVEPGENYVFTPQAGTPEAPPLEQVSSSSGRTPMVIGAVVGALLVIAIGAFFFLRDDGTTSDTDGSGEAVAATSKASPPKDDVDDTPAPTEEPEAPSRLSERIERASDLINNGDIEKAIGLLEGLEMAEPTPAERDRIDTLLSKARTESSFQEVYIIVQNHLDEEKHLDALTAMQRIPDHSLFHDLLEEQELRQQAIDGALAQARGADGDAEATSIAEQILDVDPGNDEAQAILDDLEKKRIAAATPKRTPNRTKRQPARKKPSPPSVSREEAQQLRLAANKKLFGGDPQGAITDCRKALRGGASECHRIMGIAYRKLNDKPRACSSFNKALRGNPSNAPAIQKIMTQMECK